MVGFQQVGETEECEAAPKSTILEVTQIFFEKKEQKVGIVFNEEINEEMKFIENLSF